MLSVVINMNKKLKVSIYVILSCVLLTVGVCIVYNMRSDTKGEMRLSSDPVIEQPFSDEHQSEKLQQVNGQSYTRSTHGKGSAPRETGPIIAPASETSTYTLVVTQGCLQVYVVETGMLYMETDIVYDLLPATVQAQIDKGKYFDSENALLEFLESYSS